MELRDFINAITVSKKNLIRNSDSKEAARKAYSPFVLARTMSYHEELVMITNEANQRNLGSQEHFEFFLHLTPKGKRYARWERPEAAPVIKELMTTLGYSYKKAYDLALVLTPEQIEIVCRPKDQGGVLKE